VVPFLGPAIAVWILFLLFVMTCYFLFVAGGVPPDRETSEPEASRRQAPPPVEVRPRWAEPSLPTYDMEDFPPDRWTSSSR
jgi:hypothetical protein